MTRLDQNNDNEDVTILLSWIFLNVDIVADRCPTNKHVLRVGARTRGPSEFEKSILTSRPEKSAIASKSASRIEGLHSSRYNITLKKEPHTTTFFLTLLSE